MWDYKNWLLGLLSALLIGIATHLTMTLGDIQDRLQAFQVALQTRPTFTEVRSTIENDSPYVRQAPNIAAQLEKMRELREDGEKTRLEILRQVEENRNAVQNLAIRIERLSTILERLETTLQKLMGDVKKTKLYQFAVGHEGGYA